MPVSPRSDGRQSRGDGHRYFTPDATETELRPRLAEISRYFRKTPEPPPRSCRRRVKLPLEPRQDRAAGRRRRPGGRAGAGTVRPAGPAPACRRRPRRTRRAHRQHRRKRGASAPTSSSATRRRSGTARVLHAGVYLGDDITLGDDCELFPNVVIRERITARPPRHHPRRQRPRHRRLRLPLGRQQARQGPADRHRRRRGRRRDRLLRLHRPRQVRRHPRSAAAPRSTTSCRSATTSQIGPHCIIVGQVGIAGSVTLGTGVVLGGQVAVRDHVTHRRRRHGRRPLPASPKTSRPRRRLRHCPPSPTARASASRPRCGGCRTWSRQVRKLQDRTRAIAKRPPGSCGDHDARRRGLVRRSPSTTTLTRSCCARTTASPVFSWLPASLGWRDPAARVSGYIDLRAAAREMETHYKRLRHRSCRR